MDDLDEDQQPSSQKHIAEPAGTVKTTEAVKPGPATWHTFQYRSIFGVSSLTPSMTVEGGEASSAPEVVIVERPMYDVELPPRFTSGQEWD